MQLAAPPPLGWLQLHIMYMLPGYTDYLLGVILPFHHFHHIPWRSTINISYPKQFLQINFIHFCSFLLCLSLHLPSLKVDIIMCSLYHHSILVLKRLYHTFSQRKVFCKSLHSFQMKSSSPLALWSCVDCRTVKVFVHYATWIVVSSPDRARGGHETKWIETSTNKNGSMRTTFSHAHFYNGRGRRYFSAGNEGIVSFHSELLHAFILQAIFFFLMSCE